MQIRNAPDWEDFGRNEDLDLFVEEINKNESKNQIYLSAMNKEVLENLKKRTNRLIFELRNKNYNSMQDAVCDLYIMAKADMAIYSFGSTFGELAFWLRKDMQNVIIVGNQKKWINKKHLKKSRKIKEHFYKICKFIFHKLNK